jgi:hypothetical protein
VSEEIIIRGPSGPPLCGRVRLDDFDAIPGLSPVWDERYRQIGRGRPAIQIALASTTRLQLVYMSRNPGVLVQGAAVGGAALLGIPLSGSHLFLRRKPWERDAVGYAPPGGEYDILSTSPHRMLALAVAPGLLDTVAMETLGTTMASFAGASQLRLRDPAASEALRRCWLRWLSAVAASPPLLADPAMPWEPAITTYRQNNHSVRSEAWRYTRYADGGEELYDEFQDPYEWTNLARQAEFKGTKTDLSQHLPRDNKPPARSDSIDGEPARKARKAQRLNVP